MNGRDNLIILNGESLYLRDLSLNTATSLSPKRIGSKFSAEEVPSDFQQKSISFSYFLTGIDRVKEYIFTYSSPISGWINGLSFNSGYLTSYGLNITPNQPIVASARIDFFNSVDAPLIEYPVNNFNTGYLLNGSDITILHLSGVDINTLNPNNLDYQFSVEFGPVRHAGSITPTEFTWGASAASINVTTDSTSTAQNISGEFTSFQLLFKNHNGAVVDNLAMNGLITQKNISFSPNQHTQNSYTISQFNVQKGFYFSGFDRYSGYCGEAIRGSGANIREIGSIVFNGEYINDIRILNGHTFEFDIPCGSISGNININGNLTGLNVLDSGITISGLRPISGSAWESAHGFIDIIGTGFTKISAINFGSVASPYFEVVSLNQLRAAVPKTATWGKISVISQYRNKTGISPYEFVPIPISFSYQTPLNHSFYTNPVVFSGDHFSGVTGVSFNNLPGSSTFVYGGFDNKTTIAAYVPSGNTKGYLRFYTRSGLSRLTSYTFKPEIYISGLNIISGRTGSALEITGLFLIPELMQNSNILSQPNDYNVRIGNTFSFNMTRANHTTLTGIISTGCVTGPVRIMAMDGNEYPWSGIFTILPDPPSISGCEPFLIYYPQETRAYGRNFFNVLSVEYTGGSGIPNTGLIYGYSVSSNGTQISIPSTGIRDFVSGSRTGITYGLRVRTSQGDAIKTGAFRIADYRRPSDYSFQHFSFSGYLSGYDNAQCQTNFISNLSDYPVYYRFPMVEGFNWYESGLTYAYGVGRDYLVPTGYTGTFSLCVTGSGNVYNREMSGLFRSIDGITKEFSIRMIVSGTAWSGAGGGGGGGGLMFPLDYFDSSLQPVAAYSLHRKLRSGYNGPLFRIVLQGVDSFSGLAPGDWDIYPDENGIVSEQILSAWESGIGGAAYTYSGINISVIYNQMIPQTGYSGVVVADNVEALNGPFNLYVDGTYINTNLAPIGLGGRFFRNGGKVYGSGFAKDDIAFSSYNLFRLLNANIGESGINVLSKGSGTLFINYIPAPPISDVDPLFSGYQFMYYEGTDNGGYQYFSFGTGTDFSAVSYDGVTEKYFYSTNCLTQNQPNQISCILSGAGLANEIYIGNSLITSTTTEVVTPGGAAVATNPTFGGLAGFPIYHNYMQGMYNELVLFDKPIPFSGEGSFTGLRVLVNS